MSQTSGPVPPKTKIERTVQKHFNNLLNIVHLLC